jgi:hypothetical protein
LVETKFAVPLLVWICPPKGQPVVKRICDVDTGITALTREGLGGYGVNLPEWHVALKALVRAKLEPTPEAVEAARLALKAVGLRTRSFLDG